MRPTICPHPSYHNVCDACVRDRLVAVLRAEGGDPGSSLHSWRCEHPDRYGECDCLEQIADELIRVIAPAEGVDS